MALSTQHLAGFLAGLGAAAVGFYAYKKNQDKVDSFLSKQGIKVPGKSGRDSSSMSLEELVGEKERLEDLIAEKELAPEEKTEKAAEVDGAVGG